MRRPPRKLAAAVERKPPVPIVSVWSNPLRLMSALVIRRELTVRVVTKLTPAPEILSAAVPAARPVVEYMEPGMEPEPRAMTPP